MKTFLAGLSVVALLAIGSPARAEDAPTQSQAGQPGKTTWYGWQTLIADGGTVAASLVSGNALVFAGGFTLGAPIVHWAHGNVLNGFASLGVRVGAPVLTAFAAALLLNSKETSTGHENEEALSIGILGGCLFASVFDAAVLARETTTVAPQRPAAASHWRVEPRVGLARGGVSAGVGGSF